MRHATHQGIPVGLKRLALREGCEKEEKGDIPAGE